MEIKLNGQLYSPQICKLALEIKLEENDVEEFKLLKSELLKSVQKIVWDHEVNMFTKAYGNEYLHAAFMEKDDEQRRSIYLWRTGENLDSKGSWKFSSGDGKLFLIKNNRVQEYLFAADKSFAYNSEYNYIFTRKGKSVVPEAYWRIEILNDNEFMLINNVSN
jgi:hypothetical protein